MDLALLKSIAVFFLQFDFQITCHLAQLEVSFQLKPF